MLEKLVQKYQEALAQIHGVKRAVQKADTNKMLELSAKMDEAQLEIKTIEDEFAPFLEQFPELGKSILFQDRISLIEQILREREAILLKCKGILAVNRNELGKIANGRVLMKGYHSNLQKKGRLIKITK